MELKRSRLIRIHFFVFLPDFCEFLQFFDYFLLNFMRAALPNFLKVCLHHLNFVKFLLWSVLLGQCHYIRYTTLNSYHKSFYPSNLLLQANVLFDRGSIAIAAFETKHWHGRLHCAFHIAVRHKCLDSKHCRGAAFTILIWKSHRAVDFVLLWACHRPRHLFCCSAWINNSRGTS